MEVAAVADKAVAATCLRIIILYLVEITDMNYNEVIARLIKDGKATKHEVGVKSVSYKEWDGLKYVVFALTEAIPSYVLDEEKGVYVEGTKNVVSVLLSQFIQILNEKDETAGLGKVIKASDVLANAIFRSGTISIVAEKVKKDEVYRNPFTTNGSEKTLENDNIFHHLTDFDLSRKGLNEVSELRRDIRRDAIEAARTNS